MKKERAIEKKRREQGRERGISSIDLYPSFAKLSGVSIGRSLWGRREVQPQGKKVQDLGLGISGSD